MNSSWVEISKSALIHNVKQFRTLVSGAKIMAIVKSDAYGHGLARVSEILITAGIDWLGVDSIEEAVQLRQTGAGLPILVLGYVAREQVQKAIDHDICFVSYDIDVIRGNFYGKPKIHVKVDTGMSRQGIVAGSVIDYIAQASKYARIDGILTHFANADDIENREYFNMQLNSFKEIVGKLERSGMRIPFKHAFNTPAILTHPQDCFDILRLGIGLYGLWPSAEMKNKFKGMDLRPALSWKTMVVQTKRICRGVCIGYGATEKAEKDLNIAVLPVGYFNGFDRRNSSVGKVAFNGQRAKVLGRVSMNMTVVDMTDVPGVKTGDEAELIGPNISAEEAAEQIGTISYEVVCRINSNIKRIYI